MLINPSTEILTNQGFTLEWSFYSDAAGLVEADPESFAVAFQAPGRAPVYERYGVTGFPTSGKITKVRAGRYRITLSSAYGGTHDIRIEAYGPFTPVREYTVEITETAIR